MASAATDPQSGTFVFADLVGFTALTEAHGDSEATDLAVNFIGQVRSLLTGYDGEEVKTIGDEVMIRMADPVQAVHLGLRIVEELAHHGSPPVRVGMHSGVAVQMNGDWFGGTVNLASRVADAARAGEVLMTAETRDLIEGAQDFELEERGSSYLKHIPQPVQVFRAVGPGRAGHHLEIDPVCRMAVDPDNAAGIERRRGFDYYFCSADCQHAFQAQPRRYIASSPAARVARRGFILNLTAFVVVVVTHLLVRVLGLQHHTGPSWMFVVYGAWALLLVVHYRMVRRVL